MAESNNKNTKEIKREGQPPEAETKHYTVETVLTWSAPARPFKKRSAQYFRTSILIVLLLEVLLFLFSQYMLMLVVLSLLFVSFALASVPPHENTYKISTEGLTVDDHFFLWKELYDFYFKKTFDMDVLYIRTESLVPGEIVIAIGEAVKKDQVKAALVRFLPYREVVKPTFMEKSGDWLSRNFPLEPIPNTESKPKVASS